MIIFERKLAMFERICDLVPGDVNSFFSQYATQILDSQGFLDFVIHQESL
jgi:hypothetical protein